MPKPGHWRSPACDAFVARVAAALAEERKSIVSLLEERHAAMIRDMASQGFTRSLGVATIFPDLGPEIASRESTKLEQPCSSEQVRRDLEADYAPLKSASDDWCEPAPRFDNSFPLPMNCRTSQKSSQSEDDQLLEPYNAILSADDGWQQRPESKSKSNSKLGDRSNMKQQKKTAIELSGLRMTRDLVVRRLHAKLGFLSPGELLHADDLHASLESLTLSTFDCDQVRDLLKSLREVLLSSDGTGVDSAPVTVGKRLSARISGSITASYTPVAHKLHMSAKHNRHDILFRNLKFAIPFDKFVDVMLMEDRDLEESFGEDVRDKTTVMRDVLLASDANCMVAELMHLRVDDLSRAKTAVGLLDIIEPVIGCVIILNAFLIGLQTIPSIADHPLTIAADIFITLLFIFEFAAKFRHAGPKAHFCGPEWNWNWFDFTIIVLAMIDVFLALLLVVTFDPSTLTIIRMARLVRLARLARIFRISWLSELNLVVKGLVGGLRTLFWAVVLLFFIIYIVAVFLTMAIGQQDSNDDSEFRRLRQQHFSTLPQSAFTTFRCLLVVDCAAESGKPLLSLATDRFGFIVPVFYIFLFVTVSIGLMNVIMAIYIESTLREARKTEEGNKEMRHKESLRVALQLKRFLIKICRLQIAYRGGMSEEEIGNIMNYRGKECMRMVKETLDANLEITKDVFMMAIQDPEAQQIMNDLDIPPERAHLFDALDADGSGELKPIELLNGLLQVRGESRKSDTAALLLAMRAVQSQLHLIDLKLEDNQDRIQDQIFNALVGPRQSGESGQLGSGKSLAVPPEVGPQRFYSAPG